MKIKDIGKPVTSKSLNESLAARYGSKIDLEKFTLEQLEDTRNKLRTKLKAVETMESFESVQSDVYQKTKMYLDVLNAEISERGGFTEAATGDYSAKKARAGKDIGKPGKQFGKIAKDAASRYGSKERGEKVAGAVLKKLRNESYVAEGTEDEAELVMAAKQMVERLTGWMEDVAEMQTQSMLELADSIREELGSEVSEQFVNTVKPSFESLYGVMEETRKALTTGVGLLTGDAAAQDTLGGEEGMAEPAPGADDLGAEAGMDDLDAEAGGDELDDDDLDAELAASEPSAEPRPKRESIDPRRLGMILSKKK